MAEEADAPKPVLWAGPTRKTFRAFPKPVRVTFGQAVAAAQVGGKHAAAKPLHGFGGAGVLEVVEDDDGSTYPAVYTVQFAGVVFVLHAFQKKSKVGRKTPGYEIRAVRARLKQAEAEYAEWRERQAEEAEGGPG